MILIVRPYNNICKVNIQKKVGENGICAPPNDVPGYGKEFYLDRPYTYEDSQGNKYGYGFGFGVSYQ